METVTLSSKYQLVLPKGARAHLHLKPGMKFTVIAKGSVLYLVPQRKPRIYRGMFKGPDTKDLREKRDRF